MKKGEGFTLIGELREGGYTFVTIPQLPGFSFMLEPHERMAESYHLMVPALDAFLKIRDEKTRKSLRVTNVRYEGPEHQQKVVADLCAA
jgi:hypothetical protein